jgi:adenylyl-sulfate kinase
VPPVVWLTGLPAAGKTTIGRLVAGLLEGEGVAARLIDGDVLRAEAGADLGFERADRLEQARRAMHAALAERVAGRVAVVATISPYREGREAARALLAPGFLEVFVDAPLDVCEARDPKGHYAAARRGRLRHLTGVDDPYEPPADPGLRLRTASESPEQSAARVLARLAAMVPAAARLTS